VPAFGLLKPRGLATPKGWSGSVSGPTSYPTGGFTVTVAKLRRVFDAMVEAGGGYKASVVSISANTVKVEVRYYDYPAAAAGTAIEVPAGTDLSAVTFRIVAIGD